MSGERASAPVVSHGRGGQGNIKEDSTEYVDGEIVRQGVAGESSTDGAYSTGRGGAANIGGDAGGKGQNRTDDEIVPEVAMRASQEEYHMGRGGQGNVHHTKDKDHHDGLADKLKKKLFGKKTEKTDETAI
ncbi:MAG: hypothetical protein M1839_001479 [Geoglossum umbratile]|nr:MAG: hypothetical protein M1839_001479 [Geoglossum umbratile]